MASAEVMTKRYYEEQGCTVGDGRSYNAYSKTRHDLYGFIDLLAIDDNETIAIQATIGMNNLPARVQKIVESENANRWIWGPCRRIVIVAWRKLKQRNKDGKLGKRVKYEPKIVEITLQDFEKEREDG